MKQYLNVVTKGNNIHHWYIDEDGKKQYEKVEFHPFVAVEHTSNGTPKFKSIYGEPLKILRFLSISDFYEWKRGFNAKFYGDINPEYQFIASKYREEVEYDKNAVTILNIDIETPCAEGFPDADNANYEVKTVTIQDIRKDKFWVLSFKEYTGNLLHQKNIEFLTFKDERELLSAFVNLWREIEPDIITGWNVRMYDIPYLINRIKKILGPEMAQSLSPVNKIKPGTAEGKYGKINKFYDISAVAIWDYMQLYQKYIPDVPEQWTLEFVSQRELGEGKVTHDESLWDLYNHDFNRFIDYNIQDVRLVYEIEKKRRYIDLGLSIVYMSRSRFTDLLGTIKGWDALIYSTLLTKYQVFVSNFEQNQKEQFPGGFNKVPTPGLHSWVSVFDIQSSYPNQIRSFNISPETVVADYDLAPELTEIRNKLKKIDGYTDPEKLTQYTETFKKYNVCLASNGEYFRTDIEGYIPRIVGEIFQKRLDAKKDSSESKKELEIIERLLKNQ